MPRLSKPLTDAQVRNARPKKVRYEIGDGGSGLTLRVMPNGDKAWYCRYRNEEGTQRRVKLGGVGEGAGQFTLAQARSKAGEFQSDARNGGDPARGISAERLAKDAEPTVADVVESFTQLHLPTLAKRTSVEYSKYINRDILPALGRKKIVDVEIRDVAELIDSVTRRSSRSGHPSASGRAGGMLRAVLSKTFSFAMSRGLISYNPVLATTSSVSTRTRQPRLAVQDDDKSKHVLASLIDGLKAIYSVSMDSATRRAILLQLALGLRVNEACALRVENIDLKSSHVFINGKGDKERKLPLPTFASGIVKMQMKENGASNQPHKKGSPYLFPTKSAQGHLLPESVGSAVGKASKLLPGTLRFASHALRRTAATGFRSCGASQESVKWILGHSRNHVTDLYDTHIPWNEMNDAMNSWSDRVEEAEITARTTVTSIYKM